MTWAELAKISRHLPHLGEKSDHNAQRVRKQTDLRIVYWHRAPLRRVQHVIEGGRGGTRGGRALGAGRWALELGDGVERRELQDSRRMNRGYLFFVAAAAAAALGNSVTLNVMKTLPF